MTLRLKICLLIPLFALMACSEHNENDPVPPNPFGFTGESVSGGNVAYRGTCDMSSYGQCMDYYASVPMDGAACGMGSLTTTPCSHGAGFIGACKSDSFSGAGASASVVVSYYSGMGMSTAADVQSTCVSMNGIFIAK